MAGKQPKQKGRSPAPARDREQASPLAPGFDKKLDGPNIPST